MNKLLILVITLFLFSSITSSNAGGGESTKLCKEDGWVWHYPQWNAHASDYEWWLDLSAGQQLGLNQWCGVNCEPFGQLHPACSMDNVAQGDVADDVTVHYRCFCFDPENNIAVTDLHYVFILDESGSMSGSRWSQLKAAVEAFLVVRKGLGNNDIISIITYDSGAVIQVDRQVLATYTLSIPFNGGGTSHTAALNKFLNLVPSPAAEGLPIVLSFISDGGASYPTSPITTLQGAGYQAILQRIWITGVGTNSYDTTLNKMATDLNGSGNAHFTPYTNGADLTAFYEGMAVL